MNNHFQLFKLPIQFQIDLTALDQHFRALQAEIHPDKFAAAPANEQLRAMQLATQANEAYQTLKNPTNRARYLLQLQGVDTAEETNTAMPADFLMQQLEWREAIEENANHLNDLHHLSREIKQAAQALQQNLAQQLDLDKNWQAAAESVRKLQFMNKLREEISRKIEILED